MIQRKHWSVPLGALCILGASCTRAGVPVTHSEATAEPAKVAAVPLSVLPNPALVQAANVSIADVTERALPSVVNISLTKVSQGQKVPGPFPFFFGPENQGERREQGMGSGVLVSSDGYVLTNNHVVSEASEIKVTTYDKREFDATVVGTDPKSDLAVIKMKGNLSGLKAVEFGDSSRLRLGDVVLAIGNPFGVGQTVTMGIVSAKGRADLGIVDYEDFIQTDAAINPGNSGGALVNMEGQLVGVNTAILSRSGGNQGIGFAIPTNMALPIMEGLKKNGRVTRGWLGVGIQDVDSELASAMKLPVATGVLISDVRPGTPAARAGLRRGDVVVKVDGRGITSSGQFRNAVAAAGGGHKVNLDFYRDGKSETLGIELGEMPNDPVALGSIAPSVASNSNTLDGLALSELTPEQRRQFQIPSEIDKGVVVSRVHPRSAAARAGVRPGDVLLEVNRTAVDNLQKFQEVYGKAKGAVVLLVNRRGSTVFIVVRR